MGTDLERTVPVVCVFGDPYLVVEKFLRKALCLLGVWQVYSPALQEGLKPTNQPRLAELDGGPPFLGALVAVGEVDCDGAKAAATHLIHDRLPYACGIDVDRDRRRDGPQLVAAPGRGFSDLAPALLDVPDHLGQAVGHLRVRCAERKAFQVPDEPVVLFAPFAFAPLVLDHGYGGRVVLLADVHADYYNAQPSTS